MRDVANLDTRVLVETPEGIDLSAEIVGLTPRALAFTIDFFIRLLILLLLSIPLAMLGNLGWGVYLIVWFALEWWYPVLFEYFMQGQTIGKKQMGIRTVSSKLTPLNFSAAMTRNLLRAADFLPVFYAIGAISIWVSKNKQRLGDLAADTLVVYVDSPRAKDTSAVKFKPITPVFELSSEQRRAFINFALNRGNLSHDRQTELAQVLLSVLPGEAAESPRDYVGGVGAWLLGLREESK